MRKNRTSMIESRSHIYIMRRFLERTERQGNGCLFWTGSLTNGGYGRFWIPNFKTTVLAHRWKWEETHGIVPKGLELDHLCRNRLCVEPTHLEAVTRRTNVLRSNSPCAKQAQRTHCPLGHPYDESNTLRWQGHRSCRLCHNTRVKERNRRRKIGGCA